LYSRRQSGIEVNLGRNACYLTISGFVVSLGICGQRMVN